MRFSTFLATCLASAVARGIVLPERAEYVAARSGYVFVYFTGNGQGQENIFLAASEGNDALTWTELNGGEPVLTSSKGTKGVRDPFLLRSHEGDKFYLIATDLKVADSGWTNATRHGSLYLEIWETTDLIEWSEQRHIQVSPATVGNTWAPEAYYDDELEKYVVYWASALYAKDDTSHEEDSYQRIMYATTSDFITFSEPVVWQDKDRIDTTLIKEGDVYYRFTKDSGTNGTDCVDIIQESSKDLLAPLDGWQVVVGCIGANAGTEAVEGPSIFKSNPEDINGEKFYLFLDEFTGRGYIPLETEDIANPDWKISSSYRLPSSPRHGSVVSLTKEELDGIIKAYP
ncbi:glycoside hydrolase family 43 [Fusarium albosuccineum]|uniref:Glycoside hydrolase family 43 n=1 Tax=Fusarium albosuccineum TaxID=1237068 RepID=A0A8H4L5K3_9HYPO|nr:glycoside hydrolase family 43 [Fusarium albosuccineum]